MRMNKAEVADRAQSIIDFAELGHYIDMPMSTYSSGMKARLGFAITTSAEADILVMDEWIGAGDPRFIEKCEERLATMVDKSRILILATHKERLLKRVCNRFAVLDKGRLEEVDFGGGLEQHNLSDEKSKMIAWRDKATHYREMALRKQERVEATRDKNEKLKERLLSAKADIKMLRADIKALKRK